MFTEFKEFAIKGNVVDLAVGVIIGAAFGKIVDSLVNDLVLPPFSFILGRVNFADYYLNLSGGYYRSLAEAKSHGAITLNYGAFLNNIINFLIVSFALFLVIKYINKQRREPARQPDTKQCPYCLSAVALKATRCPHCTSDLK